MDPKPILNWKHFFIILKPTLLKGMFFYSNKCPTKGLFQKEDCCRWLVFCSYFLISPFSRKLEFSLFQDKDRINCTATNNITNSSLISPNKTSRLATTTQFNQSDQNSETKTHPNKTPT